MKMIGTVLMTLTRIGVFLIASPLMLIQLIMGLGVATPVSYTHLTLPTSDLV